MVNPGAFAGQRKAFLDAQQELYAAAVAGNHVNDTVADIQRRYFKRFPITLAHTEEPTEEHLAAVDDDAPDPELAPPRDEATNPEAYARAKRVYEFQGNELTMRKAVRTLYFSKNISSALDASHLLANKTATSLRVHEDTVPTKEN